MSFFSKIFSIQNYGETHRLLYLFGIKIKFMKSQYARKKKQLSYYYYKENNIDITTLPPAEGQLRDIQLANLALLRELDHVCKKSGLQYWLDFGSVLGAVRHKGFIPWDDDIDVGMMREDYDRIIDAFEKYSRDPDIYVDLKGSEKNNCQYFLKVMHRQCPHLFVDIFPYDRSGEILTVEEQRLKTLEIKKLRKKMQQLSENKNRDDVLEIIKNGRRELLGTDKKDAESDLVWGIDFNHAWKNWYYSNDTIFPLKEIEFEGEKFLCINNIDKFLSEVYGDYMAYPRNITCGHSMLVKLSEKESGIIKKLAGRL